MNTWRDIGPVAIMAEQCSVTSPRGVVAAAAPVAARIGASILEAGGTAYDAATASALAETVLLPPKCGLAGDLVGLAWHRDDPAPTALLAIGGAPNRLGVVATRGELTPTGPMSVGVPGAPAGYTALADRCTFSLERLAEPSIQLAREGFAWSRICSELSIESAELVATHNPHGTTYFPNGSPHRPGSIVTLAGLADAIELLASDPAGFLTGPVGAAIVERVGEAGGVLSAEDMQYSLAEWTATATADGPLGSYYATPAPTHGPALLSVAAGMVQPADAGEVYRATLRAIAQSRDSLSDPSGTSMVSAVDSAGTMVTLVHSNSFPRFGSGLIEPRYDLILANRAGRGFDNRVGHPNFPEPGRRPATTLHAWAVGQSGGGRLQGATPGGVNQLPWNIQTLARLAGDPNGIAEAVVDARWAWLPEDDGVQIEDGFTDAGLESLAGVAPRIEQIARWGLRSAMQIVTDQGTEVGFRAVVDPRTGGSVIAM